MGLLGDTLFRQTDSGSDNDAKEAHALHVHLVSIGAVQKLVWLRLRPKHSHNLADRINSMCKEQIWPQKGSGGGCMAPWDMQDILQRAVQSQRGRFEFSWHFQNLDWQTFYEGHIFPNFKDYSTMRYWEYEYDESLPDQHYVRVTYAKDLLPADPNSKVPKMRPVFTDNEVCSHMHSCSVVHSPTMIAGPVHLSAPCCVHGAVGKPAHCTRWAAGDEVAAGGQQFTAD